jgi:hypothetical protein
MFKDWATVNCTQGDHNGQKIEALAPADIARLTLLIQKYF